MKLNFTGYIYRIEDLKENQFEVLEDIMIQAGELKDKINFNEVVYRVDED